MKKLLVLLLLVGCDSTVPISQTQHRIGGRNIVVVEIEGCEYIYGEFGGHKGNCKNPIHESCSHNYHLDAYDSTAILFDGDRQLPEVPYDQIDSLIYEDNR